MTNHHPDDDFLLGLAAGNLENGPSMVVSSHVESCAHCQERTRQFERVGGALLEALEPAVLATDSLTQTLAAIDASAPPAYRPPTAAGLRATLPVGMEWPRALHGCTTTRWRWLGPGMRWSRVTLPYDAAANVFLLRIGAGKKLPMHSHSELELTQVLYGTFHDGRASFGPGDFDEADGSILHQPVVLAEGECICLASVRGKVLFEGAVARWFGGLVGM
jgi:putative transcriptional regulator